MSQPLLATAVTLLRRAETIAEVATAIISELGAHARGVVVQVRCTAWLAGDAFDIDAIRRSLRERARFEQVLPVFAAGVWTVPLFGCGEVIGCIRVACADELRDRLLVLAMNASVRLAQIYDPLPGVTLTPRQREVAVLVARGCTNGEIGAMLGISSNAVKKHVSRTLSALHVSNRTELAALAGRWKVDAEPIALPGILAIEVFEQSTSSRRTQQAA